MVAATAAVAKVAAAAAASSPYSLYMSTVAVTPMAQSHRLKKAPSIDSKSIKSDTTLQEYAVISSNMGDDPLKLSVMQHQQTNGACFSVAGGLSNVKILSKTMDSRELDGPESRVVQSSVQSDCWSWQGGFLVLAIASLGNEITELKSPPEYAT